jgi:hypothetical protein
VVIAGQDWVEEGKNEKKFFKNLELRKKIYIFAL